jgi:cellulose synthase operon protein C
LQEKEAKAALDRFKTEALQIQGSTRSRFLASLADAYSQIGVPAESNGIWKLMAEEQPNNLRLQLILFDLAAVAGNEDEMRRTLNEIKKIEGEGGGPYWHFGEASLLLRQLAKEDPSGSASDKWSQVKRHLDDAQVRRPNWFRVQALLGELSDLQKDRRAALDHYRKAVALGDRRPNVLRQLVRLLAQENQFAEIDNLMGTFSELRQTVLTAGLGKLAAGSLLARDEEQALRYAKAVASDKDYKDQLWLGQLYYRMGPSHHREAQAAFEKARQLSPSSPETWVMLYTFLAKTGSKEQAKTLVSEAQKSLTKSEAYVVMALAAEADGDKESAEKHYLHALSEKKDDTTVLKNLATYYLREKRFDKAEPYLERFLRLSEKSTVPAPERAWARRGLALAYSTRGAYPDFQKAKTILMENKKDPGDTPEDVRTLALVYSTRPEHRQDAIDSFIKLYRNLPPDPEDDWLLAHLYDANRDWTGTQSCMFRLINSPHKKRPEMYAFFIERLIIHKDYNQAATILAKLAEEEPNAFLTLEMKARLHASRGEQDKAISLLKEHAAKKEAEVPRVALAFETISNLVEIAPQKKLYLQMAEDLLRDLAKRSGKPEGHIPLAGFLGRQGRVKEALDECERSMGPAPGGGPAIFIAVATLRGALPKNTDNRRVMEEWGADCKRVEDWVSAELPKSKNPTELLIFLADMSDMRGEYARTIDYNRQALKASPTNVVALNNLAWFLAVKEGNCDEALGLIQKAMDISGPIPAFLDTQGSIYLAAGKKYTDQAIKALEKANEMNPAPATSFRLARAYLSKNQLNLASQRFRQAQAQGLTEQRLHPLEQPQYRKLREELGGR